MTVETRHVYDDIRLLDIRCDSPYAWQPEDATHIRVCLPASLENQREMEAQGFFFGDRLLDVSVNLIRSKQDFSAHIRQAPRLTGDHRDEVLEIAAASFPTDRRFHLGYEYDGALARRVLRGWVEALPDYYLAEHKGQAAGFLSLARDPEQGRAFVHLAAVAQRYRMSGAALSLYAAACRDCKEQGYSYLDGCVSTKNAPVMNLYAFLGGSFGKAWDVYLKEV